MASPFDKYVRGKLLGAGSYGTATLFTTRDGKKVVIKEIDLSKLSPTDVKAAEGEVKVLQMLHNSNIVSCVESFRHQGKLCIVMDYCSEGDLQGALKRRGATPLPETTVIEWFAQICLGLKHVHDLSILHRDLKPGNIFMSSGGVLKLGDFGVSRVMDSPAALAKTMIGTPYYISPEITRCKPYNAKSDVWSLGCILYEMMTFRHPFNGRNTTELYRQIVAGVFQPIKDYSSNLKGLVAEMLAVAPNLRPSVNQILAKPFMQQHLREYLARLGIKDVAPPKALAVPPSAVPVSSRPSAAAAPAAASRVPVNLPVSKAPVPAAPPAARAHVELRAPAAAGAPMVDMEKRRLAAQQAALALQNRAVKEAQVQQAQAQARVQVADRAALDAKKRAEAVHMMEAVEADKKAKLVALQEQARREAAAKLAEKAALNAKGRHERSAQLRALSQKHRREWSSGGQQEVQHEVFAPPMPARLRQPTPEPVPRQEGRALPAARRISVNEGPRRKVGFQEADALARTRSAPSSPRGTPGASPRPGGTPEGTPPNSRGSSPDRARAPGGHGITADDRAKAYAESRAAAERNKRLVAEQEGLYYPPAGAQGQSPQMFKAFPRNGSPSVDRTLRKFQSNKEAGARRAADGRHGAEDGAAVRLDGAAMNKDLPRSESSSSQDYEEMADMLQRMKTVAEDDCFQDAVDAENDQEDEEPEEDEAARKDRMKGLREELLHQFGPQKLDRVQHLLFHADCPSKAAQTRVEQELGKLLEHTPYSVIGKLRELNTYEEDYPAPAAAAAPGKVTPRSGR